MSEGRGVDGSYGLGSASKPRQVHLTISRIPLSSRAQAKRVTRSHVAAHLQALVSQHRSRSPHGFFCRRSSEDMCLRHRTLCSPKLGERLAFQASSKLLSPLALRLPSLMPLRPWTPGFWHFAGRERSTGNRNACSKFGIRARISMLSRISCNQPRM